MANSSLSYKPFFAISGDNLETQLQRSIGWFFIVILLVIISWNFNRLFKGNTFEEAGYYQSKGYVKKVNELLEKFVKEDYSKPLSANSSMQSSLNSGRLNFFIGEDVQNIKLIGIESFTKESSKIGLQDSLFYYASNLEKHIILQKENPLRNIFKVEVEPLENSTFIIKSITLDNHIINTPIPSNPETWLGNIFVNQPSQLNSSLFLKVGINWIPLPIQEKDSSYVDIDYDIESLYKIDLNKKVIDNFFSNESKANKIAINLDLSKESRLNFRVERQGNSYKVIFNSVLKGSPSIYITTPKNTRKYDSDVTDQSIELNNGEFPCSVSYTTTDKKKYSFTLTSDSPFKKLSFVVNSTKGKQRFISKIGDYYTSQILTQIVANQNKNIKKIDKLSNVIISPNAILAQRIETQLKNHASNGAVDTVISKGMTIRLGMTILNTSNGEVLGAPFYENTESYKNNVKELKNFNLVNHTIGSTFKPLMTSAILDIDNQLYNYSLRRSELDIETIQNKQKSKREERVNSISIDRMYPFEKSFNLGAGLEIGKELINMRDYIRYSNDAFPVALLIKATKEKKIVSVEGQKTMISTDFITSNFKQKMEQNFAIMMGAVSSQFVDIRCWLKNPNTQIKNYSDSLQLFNLLSPETVNLRGDLIGTTGRNSFSTEMIPWILGSGSNWWNNIKVAESYCRLITNKNIFANFKCDEIKLNKNNIAKDVNEITKVKESKIAKGKFINDMSTNINSYATWSNSINTSLTNMGGDSDSLVIIAKTGTPSSFVGLERTTARGYANSVKINQGIFAFTVMSKNQFTKLMKYYETGENRPEKLGVTCYLSIYVTHFGRNDITESGNAVKFISDRVLKDLVSQNRHLF